MFIYIYINVWSPLYGWDCGLNGEELDLDLLRAYKKGLNDHLNSVANNSLIDEETEMGDILRNIEFVAIDLNTDV